MGETTKFEAALNTEFWSHDRDEVITLRQYLAELLIAIVTEGEGFSGKRPFGNSGWESFALGPMIKAGVIAGKIDGDLTDPDHEVSRYHPAQAEDKLVEIIQHVMGAS